MIYGDLILEQKRNELFKPSNEIMLEYYKNEIDILRSTIQYQNEISVCESAYELQVLQEGVIGNIIDKIKEMIEKFFDWIKRVVQSIKDFFTKSSKTVDQKVNDAEKEIKNAQNPEEIKKAASKTGSLTVTENNTYVLKRLKAKEFVDTVESAYNKKLNIFRSKMEDLGKKYEKSFSLFKLLDSDIDFNDMKVEEFDNSLNALDEAMDSINDAVEEVNKLNSGIHINDYINTYQYKTANELKSAAEQFIRYDKYAIKAIEEEMVKIKKETEEEEKDIKHVEAGIRITEKQAKKSNEELPAILNKFFTVIRRLINIYTMASNTICGATLGFYNQAIRQIYSQLKIAKAK